ncbi:MAG: CmcJ/NvfI family oxidoreductase [Pseudomonadota bacterium]
MDQVAEMTSSTEAQSQKASVEAPLTFIRRQETKPVFHSSALTGDVPKIFFDVEERRLAIEDMREVTESLSLDREGFALRTHDSAVRDFYDDDEIEDFYYPEIESLLKNALGASKVAIFDVTRRSDTGHGAANPDGRRGPATRVHVDYTVKSGPQRVKDILGEEEAARLQANGARIVQVNVWRPIRGPVERSPLALADASTVPEEDLVATDQVFPDRIGEIYSVAHSPSQRWYYAPRMATNEVLLIKGWDSVDDGRARFTPHGAFPLPNTTDDAPARESIEVRTLVIIE